MQMQETLGPLKSRNCSEPLSHLSKSLGVICDLPLMTTSSNKYTLAPKASLGELRLALSRFSSILVLPIP